MERTPTIWVRYGSISATEMQQMCWMCYLMACHLMEFIGWYHQFMMAMNLGDVEGQGGLACCSLWGCRVRHDLVTQQ